MTFYRLYGKPWQSGPVLEPVGKGTSLERVGQAIYECLCLAYLVEMGTMEGLVTATQFVWSTKVGSSLLLVSLWAITSRERDTRNTCNMKYGYGSIPINTIFRGMNIHLPAILMFTRGTRFWHTAICMFQANNFTLAVRASSAAICWSLTLQQRILCQGRQPWWLRGCQASRPWNSSKIRSILTEYNECIQTNGHEVLAWRKVIESLEDLIEFVWVVAFRRNPEEDAWLSSFSTCTLTKFSAEGPQGQRARLLQMDQAIHAE